MSTRSLFFAAAFVLGLAPLGCSGADATDEATLDEGADALTNVGATLKEADNGKTISVNEGTPFATGTHTVKLAYARNWEKTALKTYEFTVDVSH